LRDGQGPADDVAFRLLGQQEIGGAHERQQDPDDQRVGVDHAQDVEGHQFRQEIGQHVDRRRQQAERDLDDEQQERTREEMKCQLLRWV